MYLLATLLALIGCSHAVVFQVPLTKVEPPMIKMLRDGTWGAYVQRLREKRPLRSAKESILSIYDHKVNGFADTSYVANITIGNPDQMFRVILDTGSSPLWVPDSTCGRPKEPGCESSECDRGAICPIMCPKKECCVVKNMRDGVDPCKGKNLFQLEKSTTYRRIQKSWRIYYGTGDAAGYTGQDTVRFGESGVRLAVAGIQFGQASHLDDFFDEKPFDGILGMAYDNYDKWNIYPAIHRAARFGLLEQPVFTAFLKSVGTEKNVYGGVFTYGAVDPRNCGRILDYRSLTSSYYWQFRMDAVSAGNYTSDIGWEAISDTGSSIIGGPPAIIFKIGKELGANYYNYLGIFEIDCNKKPSLEFTIGSRKYLIETQNIVVTVSEDFCVLAIAPMVLPGGPEWILGDPFIRQYCNIYDLGKKRIGFASVRKS